MSRDVRQTRRHRTEKAAMQATRGTTCWICGHPGALEADHATPLARGGSPDASNLRPAHGTSCRCQYGCVDRHGQPKACNQTRGVGEPELPPLRTSRDW